VTSYPEFVLCVLALCWLVFQLGRPLLQGEEPADRETLILAAAMLLVLGAHFALYPAAWSASRRLLRHDDPAAGAHAHRRPAAARQLKLRISRGGLPGLPAEDGALAVSPSDSRSARRTCR